MIRQKNGYSLVLIVLMSTFILSLMDLIVSLPKFKYYFLSFFFADAYTSWQRGSNENANGLLREYFPKKTDLAAICEEDLNKVLFIDHENI